MQSPRPPLFANLLIVTVCVAPALAAGAQAVTYPAPRGIEPSADYQVRAGDKDVFVYKTPVFSMATFALSGEVDVVVTVQRPITRPVVRPLSRGIKAVVDGSKLRLHLAGPCQLALEVDDDTHRPLFLFANAPEENAPKPGEAHIHYFEGGKVHDAGRIELKDNETLYLAGGAVVRGTVRASRASHVRILGPGILDASTRNNQAKMISLENCSNVDISDLIVLGSYGWTIVPRLSENVRLRNVKVLSWRDNDDGCDPDSSRHVSIDSCFFRTKDDCIAVKSHDNSAAPGSKPGGGSSGGDANAFNTENVQVTNTILWSSEWGHALTVGFAIRSPSVRNITFAHCDVIKKEKGPALSIDNHDLGAVEGVRFEDIRIEDGCDKLLAVKVAFSEYSADCPSEYFRNNPARKQPRGEEWLKIVQEKKSARRGTIRNVVFKDIQILGDRLPESEIKGFSARNEIGDVVFENVRFQGKALRSPEAAGLKILNATGVRFVE